MHNIRMKDVPASTTGLHDQAMNYAHDAFILRLRDQKQADELFQKAYVLELQAAESLKATTREPSRSILYRSAAWLALHCTDYEGALYCAMVGLAGNPPADIRAELIEVQKHAEEARDARPS